MPSESLNGSSHDRHALVIGGSMAGLLAARVLANHFDRVTIIERDSLPRTAEHRKGVPQSRHVHTLMLRGRMIMEQLFPDLEHELMAAGAARVDMGQDVAWLTTAGWGLRFPASLPLLTCSRELLEWSVRRRVMSISNVHFVEQCDVTALAPSADGQRVVGAHLHARAGGELAGQTMRADLVVDASGRSSRAPQWLTMLGYPEPHETVIDAHLGYASRLYRQPDRAADDWRALFVQAVPPMITRGAVLFPVEGNHWLVTLYGVGRDYPPTDEDGFARFAASLRTAEMYHAIMSATPASPIVGYRSTQNRLRHFDQLARWPDGFVVLGDAACAFNPVYGQGMTTAALGVMALDACLRTQAALIRRGFAGGRTGMAHRFQKELAKVNAGPWTLATGEDFRVRGTEGGRPDWATMLMHAYMDRVTRLTTTDPDVRRMVMEVMHMLKPPTVLFHPRILARVLKPGFGRRAADAASPLPTQHVESTPLVH